MWKVINNNMGSDKDINIMDGYYDNENLYNVALQNEANGDADILKELQYRDIINDGYDKFYEKHFENVDNKVYVYIAKIDDIINYCKSNEKCDINENKRLIHTKAGYELLKYAVNDQWGIKEDLSNIKVSPNGKPYTDNYKFSISHCGDLVCVAISEKEVGVDLECISKKYYLLYARRN